MDKLLTVVRPYLLLCVVAFVVATFATPFAIRLARRLGVMDYPDQHLKPHAKPIPYLGGMAIALGWAVAVLAAVLRGSLGAELAVPILLGGLAMATMGLVDDIRHISPKLRLIVGTVVITAVLLVTRVGFRLVDSILGPLEVPVPEFVAVPVSVLISIFVVLGACNSANLIDGLDGLCSGVTAIVSLGFFLLAAHLACWNYSDQGDPVRLTLAVAMFGAAVGFLPWNFNPAKVFMGDAGSVLLGYNCGMLILLFAERGIVRWVIGALMIFALPIFDTALAMFRRWRSGRSIFAGDRSHFYDQLVHRGFTVRQTVFVCYGLTVLYGALGLLLTWVHDTPVIRTRYAIPLYVGICALTAFLAWRYGLTHPEEQPPDQGTTGHS